VEISPLKLRDAFLAFLLSSTLVEAAMKLIYPAILACAALAGVALFTLSLAGKQPAVPYLTVALPGGEMQTMTYTGDVQPKVRVYSDPAEIAWPAAASFGLVPPFAALERLSFDMDREMDALVREADTLARLPASPDLSQATLQGLPAGEASYSLIFESVGDGTCTRLVQIAQRAAGEKPEMVSRASGNCGAGTSRVLSPEQTFTGSATAIPAQMTTPPPVTARATL
jgi:hypothetical protein